MSWVREAHQMFVSIRTCELLGTASSKEKIPSSTPVFRENKYVFSVKILPFQIYLINTQVSIYLYIQSVHSTSVNRAPSAVASDRSALNVWFQIQEDEQQIGLNKHLRDAAMVFTKSAPHLTVSQARQMPKNLPVKVRQGFSGDMATDFKWGF